jgi:tetratricopeptide (TPR) repeat protein
MPKTFSAAIFFVLTTIVLMTGCGQKTPIETTLIQQTVPPTGYFHTPFQSESQFIVEAIVSDLAEQIYYAAKQRLPDAKYYSVSATEKPGSPVDAPAYEVQVSLDEKTTGLKFDLNVNGPIWSPEVYHDLVITLAGAAGLEPGAGHRTTNTKLLSKLMDGTPETIERENQALSQALKGDFTNPELHEQAALLLGAFLLRDHSGNFFEIRSPLSRMTAHLALAHFLSGTEPYDYNGQFAEAILLTLMNDQAKALEQLDSIGTNNAALIPMIRALRARNTGDYRSLNEVAGLSPVECVEWFSAMSGYVAIPVAWPKLNDSQQRTIDYVRVANENVYSVEIGHQLLAVSIPLELQEIASVYELSHHEKLSRNGLVNALNEMPERCFSTDTDGSVQVHVISWGQWAAFLQRHLCHAIQQNVYFMESMWGVPEDAKAFANQNNQAFGGLRLYPFVRRFGCTDVEGYHQSVDDGFKVTVATPQLVPAECWNYLCYQVNFAPWYNPNPNPHINEWHSHNPPPGTDYDLHPRLNHPSLINRPDAVVRFEQLHELAPYDCRIVDFILERKYNNRPTFDQAMALYRDLLPYSVTALCNVANTVTNKPGQYEELMLQAAALNPANYYDLGEYFVSHNAEDKGAQYIDKACETDPDSVRISDHAEWRVSYYLKKGQTQKAREIADTAGEVYSYAGLAAKAEFFEATSNYDGAFEWFSKIEERYNDSKPIINYCLRYKATTGDMRFDSELQSRVPKLFPNGQEKVSLADFRGPPTDGVVFLQQSDLLHSAGMKQGDVIEALNGIRVHSTIQFSYLRDSQSYPDMDLIVWQGDGYHEIKASPPNHRFGVNVDDYNPN